MGQIAEKVGARIRQIRKSQKLTQAQLAEKTDLSDDYIGAIERGSRSPSLEVLEKIAQALQISLKDLFDFPEGKPTKQEQLLTGLHGFLKNKAADQIELILDIAKRIFR